MIKRTPHFALQVLLTAVLFTGVLGAGSARAQSSEAEGRISEVRFDLVGHIHAHEPMSGFESESGLENEHPDHSMADILDGTTIRCLTPFLVDTGQSAEPGSDAHPHTEVFQSGPRPQPMPLSFTVPTDPEISANIAGTDTTEVHSYISESGLFRLLYTTEGPDSVWTVETGINQPGIPDYIVLAAQYADSSYRHQVEQLGYTDPLNSTRCDSAIGPQIDIVFGDIREINGAKVYGYFDPVTPSRLYVNSTFSDPAFLRNDDDDEIAGIPGILGALKVTIAHELKHAIQYATNCFSGNEINVHWVEMDATMMENVVFPNVNDYYNYIGGTAGIFGNPQTRFPRAYSHVTFMLYYHEDFGPGFWVDVWDVIGEEHLSGRNIPMLAAMERVIEQRRDDGNHDHNSTGDSIPDLEQSLLRNYLWHLASGNRSLFSYGFSERDNYPTAEVIGSYGAIPEWPDDPATVLYHSARFFEFRADEMDAAGEVALALFNSSQPLSLGFLGKTYNGVVREFLVKAGDENRQKLAFPTDWTHLDWLGLVAMNTVGGSPVNRMQLLAGEGAAVERIPYGNITRSGTVDVDDARWMLSRALNPAIPAPFENFVADVSGNGSISPYDASRVLMHLENGTPFPRDENEDNLGPEWSRFAAIGQEPDPPAAELLGSSSHETGSVGLISSKTGATSMKTSPATSKTGPASPDTVTAELVLLESEVLAEQKMDIQLRITSTQEQDGDVHPWSSLLLELEIDFPPEDGGTVPGDPISLELVDLMPGNANEGVGLWNFELRKDKIRLVYASSDPLARQENPSDILTLRLVPLNEGHMHFRIRELQLDEYDYVVSHPAMDTLRVIGPVFADGTQETAQEVPLDFALKQNYPNPFNPETVIRFTLPESGQATLRVYDITGRRVATLVDAHLDRGEHRVRFDASEAGGITSGVYLYRLTGPGGSQTRKMTVIK